jgi:hypothetical protein
MKFVFGAIILLGLIYIVWDTFWRQLYPFADIIRLGAMIVVFGTAIFWP